MSSYIPLWIAKRQSTMRWLRNQLEVKSPSTFSFLYFKLTLLHPSSHFISNIFQSLECSIGLDSTRPVSGNLIFAWNHQRHAANIWGDCFLSCTVIFNWLWYDDWDRERDDAVPGIAGLASKVNGLCGAFGEHFMPKAECSPPQSQRFTSFLVGLWLSLYS